MNRQTFHAISGTIRRLRLRRVFCASLLCLAALPCAEAAPAQPAAHDILFEGFRAPPSTARPHVLWPWMNGNVTKTGIWRDLGWMKRVGIVGVMTADAAIDTPQVVKQRLAYMSPAWKDAFRSAVSLAARYHIDVGIDAAPGWSMTGGPWVEPQAAMKKLVWSRIDVPGGKPFLGVLPQPPSNIGPFQNTPMAGSEKPTPKTAAQHFYRDSIVIAYPTPVAQPIPVSVRSQSGPLDAKSLTDGDLTNGTALKPEGPDGEVWIAADFGTPVTIQGLTLGMNAAQSLGYRALVEASDDGAVWRPVATFPEAAQLQRFQMGEQTISFAPATAIMFRLRLIPASPLPRSLRPTASAAPGAIRPHSTTQATANPVLGGDAVPRVYRVNELVFHAAATVHEFEKKAMFAAPPRDFYAIAAPPIFAPGSAIDPAKVAVLSDRMQPDGRLDWTPPPGDWTVLRLGYALTGAENHPAPPEATGLEVDKLNADHVRAYLNRFLDTYESVVGASRFGARGLTTIEIGSSEIGQQNWTEDILAEFRKRCGYDPTPYLPALTGAAVTSPMASDRFLWDFRRTVQQLLAENHYGVIAEVVRARGLKSQGEALEDHRPTFGDDMAMRRYFDVPMAALWTYDSESFPATLTYEADVLGAASVAHVYGQNLVATESLTSDLQPWAWGPRGLKPYIDMEFARGTNLVFLHTSVHQPTEQVPGLSLFGYGQFFNRHEAWATLAKPWLDYIARCSYLLQQGRFAADVAFFYGEEAPITSLWGNRRIDDVPQGYAFDFFNAEALLGRLQVDGDGLVTPSGMRYRVLYLGGSSSRMTLTVLRKIHALADAGAVIVGKRPVASPSLADDPDAFAAEAEAVFGPVEGNAMCSVGKGKVFASGSLAEAFAAMKLPPDFSYAKPQPDSEILYIHRRLKDGELYFISNRRDRPQDLTARFRVAGFRPELWDAVSGGKTWANSSRRDGLTEVGLSLPANGSVFVMFRTRGRPTVVPAPTEETVTTLSGPWHLEFQKNRGAPAALDLKTLEWWNDSAVEGIKYFSGRADYGKTFVLPHDAFRPGTKLLLDLGEVREIAEVTLNGKPVGSVWTPPYRVDITKIARPGRNVLRVKLANLWVNRLIGDAQPTAARTLTFTIVPTYRPDAPLRPSGLRGPVRVLQVR